MDSIVITGFMGSGKSTVARLLASRLGVGLIDLDQVVEAQQGRTIAEIFAHEGEAAFRRIERAALEQALSRPGVVIATGGGTLVAPEAMALARRRARVVALQVSLETVWARVGGDAGRPLLAGGREAVGELLRSRASAYARAERVVSTEGRTALEVVGELEHWLQTGHDSELRRILARDPAEGEIVDLEVPLGERRYRLEFSAGGRHRLGARVRELFPKARKVAVVTNPTVGALYFEELARGLEAEGLRVVRIDIPDWEEAKRLAEVERVLELLIEQRFERREPFIALGGGVVGDFTGFVASIYLRGVPFIQVPTTLLAQVDSSIGGKTGVNSPRGKNLIGSFYQPAHVLIDVEVLRTLPAQEFRAGLAEVIKYGAIRDLSFLAWLEASRAAVAGQQREALERLIHRSCANKAEVVVADELEQGERALLNFGHTLGHAFETLGAYQGLKHGEAVAIGMVFAAFLSHRRGLCPSGELERLVGLLEAYGLPLRPPPCSVEDCLRVMSIDKKVSQGGVKFVVIDALGRARIEPLSFAEIATELREFLENPA